MSSLCNANEKAKYECIVNNSKSSTCIVHKTHDIEVFS